MGKFDDAPDQNKFDASKPLESGTGRYSHGGETSAEEAHNRLRSDEIERTNWLVKNFNADMNGKDLYELETTLKDGPIIQGLADNERKELLAKVSGVRKERRQASIEEAQNRVRGKFE